MTLFTSRKTFLFLLTLLLYVVFVSPLIYEWDMKLQAFITLIMIQILWIGRVFPLAFSTLLLMLILSFHFFSYEETLSYFGSGLVWLLFSTFILSSAFIETGLASRLSLRMLRSSQGSGNKLLLSSFLLMFVLSLFIPSNIAKGSLVTSVMDKIAKHMEPVHGVPRLSKSFFIGIAYVVAISGAIVATGASSTIYAFGMLTSISEHTNFMTWFVYVAPPILLFIVMLWVVLMSCFPPERVDRTIVMEQIDEALLALGTMKRNEWKVLIIIALTLVLWITQHVHGYSIPVIGLFGACLTLLPGIGVWEWHQAKTSIDWDLIVFFAGTLMMSNLLIETGTMHWVGKALLEGLGGLAPAAIVMILIVAVAFIRVIFVNVLGFMTIMLPLAITMGENVSGLSPTVLVLGVYLMGVPGFHLITQSPVHLISYSYGYFTEKDLLRVGMICSVLWFGIVLSAMFFYWNHLF